MNDFGYRAIFTRRAVFPNHPKLHIFKAYLILYPGRSKTGSMESVAGTKGRDYGGVLSFAVKRISEIFQAGSHVYLEKPVALAFKPLGKIAGPDPFLIGRRFAIKIYKAVVGVDDMLLFSRIDAEPATGLPGGGAIFPVQIVYDNVDRTETVIFYEDLGKPIFRRGFAVQFGLDLG